MNESSSTDSAAVASETGALAKNLGGAASSSHSVVGRLGEAVAAAKIGSKVLPAAWRTAKRQPLIASLATLLLVGAAFMLLPRIRPAQRNTR